MISTCSAFCARAAGGFPGAPATMNLPRSRPRRSRGLSASMRRHSEQDSPCGDQRPRAARSRAGRSGPFRRPDPTVRRPRRAPAARRRRRGYARRGCASSPLRRGPGRSAPARRSAGARRAVRAWSAWAEKPLMVWMRARTGISSPKRSTCLAPSMMLRASVPPAAKPTNTMLDSGAPEIVLEMMAHAPAGAHARAGHDDRAAADTVERHGICAARA